MLTRLTGYRITSIWPIFKTKISIVQSRANLDEKILFCKIIRHLEPEIWKMPYLGMRSPYSILVRDFLGIEIKALFLKLRMALNLNFNVT